MSQSFHRSLFRRRRYAADGLRWVEVPSVSQCGGERKTLRERLRQGPTVLRYTALVLVAMALAGPTAPESARAITPSGLDIMLLIDGSRSMLAQDPEGIRFEAARELAERLIIERRQGRFGLMVFAAGARLHCPLTTDYEAVVDALRAVQPLEEEQGTALGAAILSAVKQLRAMSRGPRAIVLLSDGGSNAGEVSLEKVAAIATAMDVPIYAVGVGGHGPARYSTEGGVIEVTLDFDEGRLQALASSTGGGYVSLRDASGFERLCGHLDGIETPGRVTPRGGSRSGVFGLYIVAAVLCVLCELWLRAGYLRTFP